MTIAMQDINAPQNYIIIPDYQDKYPFDENLTVCGLEGFFEDFKATH